MMRIRAFKLDVARLVYTGLSAVLVLAAWASVSHGAEEHPSPHQNLSLSIDYYVDWGSGACGEGRVTNQGSRQIDWEVCVELAGLVTTHWNSHMNEDWRAQCPQNSGGHPWKFVGADWNRTLGPGASTTFGFCVDWTQQPDPIEEEPVDFPVDPDEEEPLPADPISPPDEPEDPVMPPTDDHHDHDHTPLPAPPGDYVDITTWGTFHG
ncbi:MAG: cellulose binding domain-containing protein, partial [Candidatus Binatia bacterium]|nr:cellulose binding domain-containing protein [Candidatus Binatia bacterium]